MTYHINKKGDAGFCRAETGKCPFGGSSEHHESLLEAQRAFEASEGPTTAVIMIRHIIVTDSVAKSERSYSR